MPGSGDESNQIWSVACMLKAPDLAISEVKI